MWVEGTVLCVSVCVLPQDCCKIRLSQNLNNASYKRGNLRQKVVLYKIGKFLQVSVVQVVFKLVQILHKRLLNQVIIKGIIVPETQSEEEIMWEFQQKCLCMKIFHCVLTLPIVILLIRSLDCASVLHNNSYYTIVASISW